MDTRWYSQRLGMLSTQQLQTALDRFQLGNFGQNVFLTSTQGAFVLRGNPLDASQFK